MFNALQSADLPRNIFVTNLMSCESHWLGSTG